jgi:LysM repeat protein
MLKRPLPVFLLLLIPFFFSCRTSKKLASSDHKGQQVPLAQSAIDYVNTYKDIAISEMKRTGIPASITLAQGMVESDMGRSSLARNANNHFGIKCHDDWTGPSVIQDDDSKGECFRKYSSAENSFYDHSEFLKTKPRYSFLFDIDPSDYKAWAQGLKKAGYATNPDYPNMLIRKIEENNLEYFDRQAKMGKATASKQSHQAETALKNSAPAVSDSSSVVASQVSEPPGNALADAPAPSKSLPVKNGGKSSSSDTPVNTNIAVYAHAPRVQENNKLQYVIVKDGDTREKLEQEFQLLKWELPRYNDLESGFQLTPGQILYIQPKRDKAEAGKEFYIVAPGDTMYGISQKYGIKLKSLYSMNRMQDGTEAEAGKKIWLRSTKPAD